MSNNKDIFKMYGLVNLLLNVSINFIWEMNPIFRIFASKNIFLQQRLV